MFTTTIHENFKFPLQKNKLSRINQMKCLMSNNLNFYALLEISLKKPVE